MKGKEQGAFWGFLALHPYCPTSLNSFDELPVNWTIGLSFWPDIYSYFEAKKYPCSLGDIWLTVCMLL